MGSLLVIIIRGGSLEEFSSMELQLYRNLRRSPGVIILQLGANTGKGEAPKICNSGSVMFPNPVIRVI